MTQLMIDVTGKSLPGLLTALGGRYPGVLAGYVTGTPDIDWPAFRFTELTGHVGLFRIDQSPGLALFASGAADGADIEQGAADIAHAAEVTAGREKHGWWSWWYLSHSLLADARKASEAAGFRRLHFWVADWGMSLASASAFLDANRDTDAVQWASPTSNPDTQCPGTGRTLSELNCDLSVARSGWFDPPKLPPPVRQVTTVTVGFSDGSSVSYG